MLRIAHNKLDLVGHKYGRLLVLKEVGRTDKQSVLWSCQCDCGEKIDVSADSLRSGNTKSCGCYQRDRASETSRLPLGEAAFTAVYAGYRRHAKVKQLFFGVSKEVFRKLITKECFYCGSPPVEYQDEPSRNGKFIRNGLDRVDNTKGYTEDNIVPCCKTCNIMKKAMDIGEFLGQINKIARRHLLI